MTNEQLKILQDHFKKAQSQSEQQKINDFIHYFDSFYNLENGLYPMEQYTENDILEAIEIRKIENPTLAFEGDSIDRETIRDIILRKGYKIHY